jgi:ubiquinone/menaquinone biosynthesis C-methylase UbiE
MSTTQMRAGGFNPEVERARAAWDAIAPGYDEFVTAPGRALAEEALRRAGIRPGMRVLDVAAGSGALALPAARMGARVVAVDLSPRMLERLTARARAEGLSSLRTAVMDGHALELEDEVFDLSASMFGVMLFPDMPRALREMARVTKPDGRVVLVVYAPPAQIDFLRFFTGALRSVVPGFAGLPEDPPPLPFQAADPRTLHLRLAEAGLKEVRVENAAEELEIHSGKHLWDWVTNSNPIGRMMVADLTPEQEALVQEELEVSVRHQARGSGPAILVNAVCIGIGTK